MLWKLIKLPIKAALLPSKLVFVLAKRLLDTRRARQDAPPPSPSPSAPDAPSPDEVALAPKEILAKVRGGEAGVFVDVREPQELAAAGKIDGSLHIPLRDLPRRFGELDGDRKIYLYCAAGMRSLDAAMFLRDKGYAQAFSIEGGLPGWQHEGGEVVSA